MDQNILYGVGKKTRLAYQRGEIPASKVESIYAHNLKEAESFSVYGLKPTDLHMMLRSCHNPILKSKIEECIRSFNTKSQKSNEQNRISIEKLNCFLDNALGVGLRRIIRVMKKEARKSDDLTLKVVATLLEVEFANLSAKTHGSRLKEVIYERKSLLLDKIGYMLEGSEWKYGYNDNCGKNASYLIYVYLPDGVQLSWHSNDYNLYQKFPYIEAEWDGKVCATMEKLVEYVGKNYAHFFAPIPSTEFNAIFTKSAKEVAGIPTKTETSTQTN